MNTDKRVKYKFHKIGQQRIFNSKWLDMKIIFFYIMWSNSDNDKKIDNSDNYK